MERTSRGVAVVALLASAAFFAWYGLAYGASSPGTLPFFGAAALMWVIAAAGVSRRRVWGPSFAAGLSTVSILTMLPAGLHASVRVFLGAQVVLLAALAGRALAASTLEGARPDQWRHAGLGYATGLAVPYLIVVGFFPGLGCGAAALGLAAFALGASGIGAAFQGRTWGLFAMAGALPLLLAIPEGGWGCQLGLHDRAGELASIGLAMALVPWIGPVLRRLRGGASRGV